MQKNIVIKARQYEYYRKKNISLWINPTIFSDKIKIHFLNPSRFCRLCLLRKKKNDALFRKRDLQTLSNLIGASHSYWEIIELFNTVLSHLYVLTFARTLTACKGISNLTYSIEEKFYQCWKQNFPFNNDFDFIRIWSVKLTFVMSMCFVVYDYDIIFEWVPF